MNLTSRFILKSDPKNKEIFFNLPDYWPSRLYEYEWALGFAEKDDVADVS